MRTRGRPSGAAGRSPRGGRTVPSRARRSRAAPPRRAEPAPRVRRATLTTRAAILAVALLSVVLALALPFKIWVAQRGKIHDLESQTRAKQRQVAALRHQAQQWRDPAYVRQQARLRLHYAMPGDTSYVVIGQPPADKPSPTDAIDPAPTTSGPWFSRLWQTVKTAGGTHNR